MSEKVTLELTKLDLSIIHGWANFVKFSEDGAWDEDDQAARLKIYEALLPLVRGIASDVERYGKVAGWR